MIFTVLKHLTFAYFMAQIALSYFWGIDLTQYLSNTFFIAFTFFNGVRSYFQKAKDLFNDILGYTGSQTVTKPSIVNNNNNHDWSTVNEMKRKAEVLRESKDLINEKSNEYKLKIGNKTWSFFEETPKIEADKSWKSYLNENKYTIIAATAASVVLISFVFFPE